MTSVYKNLLFIFILLGLSSDLLAQNELAIGEWRSHLPYRCFKYLAQSPTTLYCATSESLMMLDKDEMSVSFMSTVDGLSNSGMGIIKYNEANDVLIASYSNSVFDLVTPTQIITFEDIKTDGNFGDRTIYDIYLYEDDLAFFSCGFGVVLFDVSDREFVFTADLGIRVNGLTIYKDTIYAATEDGIYYVPYTDDINFQDIGNWVLLDVNDGFPAIYSSRAIANFNDQLYFDIDGALYRLGTGMIEEIYGESGFKTQYLTTEGEGLIYGMRCDGSCNGKSFYINTDETLTELGFSCAPRPLYAIEDEQKRVWLADDFRGLRQSTSTGNACSPIEFNSPLSQNSSEILIYKNDIYIASGGVNGSGSYAGRSDGVFIKKDADWEIINRWTRPVLEAEAANLDFYKMAINTQNDKVYLGSFWGGLVEKDGEELSVYNDVNSSLQGAEGDELRVRISGLAFDESGNLWMNNHIAPKPLSVYTAEGNWKNFSVPSSRGLRHLVIDKNGYLWSAIDGTSEGVLVYDYAGTIDDTSDDRHRIISSGNTELPDNNVFSIAVDLEGDVWLGTANGVAVVECGSSVFDAERCNVSKRIIEENEFDDENEYLLKGEEVNTIAVDGANRKWFGTTNGVFLQSASGEAQIDFFDTSNSPLFDNNIIDIAINEENGEVFFGTNKGVISYRAEATTGGVVNSSNVLAYPNPVRPEYDGPIAIKGLAEGADVKITDVTGQLIFETNALGGQAIWDGKDYNGRRASTGVYLVFSTSNSLELPDAIVTKILFIN